MNQVIPYGYCHCGCGEKTVVAPHTDRRNGWTKGEPKRFLSRHHLRVQKRRPVEERFWEKVKITEGCWLWTASRHRQGYGQFHFDGEPTVAHRVSYFLLYGPIPEGVHLHHKCENKLCVNPAHLQPLTLSEHSKLHGGGSAAKANALKTHCLRGHPFDSENTYVNATTGSRQCRTCRKEQAERRREEANG